MAYGERSGSVDPGRASTRAGSAYLDLIACPVGWRFEVNSAEDGLISGWRLTKAGAKRAGRRLARRLSR